MPQHRCFLTHIIGRFLLSIGADHCIPVVAAVRIATYAGLILKGGLMLKCRSVACAVLITAVFTSVSSAVAREWSDASGKYKWTGDIFAADEDIVVVRHHTGKLRCAMTRQLSQADQEAVRLYLENAAANDDRVVQTWVMRSGLRIRAELIGYKSGTVAIENREGVVYVNKVQLRKIDPVYQAILPRIIAVNDDPTVGTEKQFRSWARKLRSTREIQVDGVLMRFAGGDEYAVPLFLFSDADKEILSAGWKQWSDDQATEKQRKQEDLLIRAEAAAYKQQQQQKASREHQIQMMQLGMLAVDAGITSIWEVHIAPASGGRTMRVVVPAKTVRSLEPQL